MVATDDLENLRGARLPTSPRPTLPATGILPDQYVIRYLRRQDAYVVFLRRFQLFEGT